MSLTGLLDAVVRDPALAEALQAAADGNRPHVDLVGPPAARPLAVAALARQAGRPVLAVTATGREAEDLAATLRSLMPAGEDNSVVEFPSWETLPHERLSPRSDTVGRRLAVLRRLAHPRADDPMAGPVSVVVAPIRSVLQPQVKGLGDLEPVSLRTGQSADLEEIVDGLAAAAYARVELVEKRGEFAVRGGILDVFPPTEEHPLRVEFWGDDVEEIRYFKVADQRSLEVAEHGLWAPPCRELLLTDTVRERAAALAEKHPELGELLGKIAEGIAVDGMESLAPVLVDDMELLLDVLPAGSMTLVCDPERVRTRAADLVATSQEFLQASWAASAGGGQAPIDVGAASLWGLADVRDRARELGMMWWSVSPFASGEELEGDGDTLKLGMHAPDTYRGDTQRALADTKQWLGDGWRTLFLTEGHGPAARTVEVLGGEGIPARLDADLAELSPSLVHVSCSTLDNGFIDPDLRIAVLTETDLSGQKAAGKDGARMPARRRKTIDPLTLEAGDFIVHEQHGVGRYIEMVQRTVQGATREYLLVEYAPAKRGQPGDRLYIPTDQLEQVTKYVGGEAPTLHRLGGADWTKTKARAKKAVKEIAADLIKLYSARMAAPGHTFGPDTPWQRELEDAFPYAETPDQLSTIAEVKEDMEKSVPMDRLICGDVGYGKTEIAVRAAFKAVQDGKQVAVLVPTTLLVQQHLGTFTERYGQFPVNVRALSRFQTDGEAKAVIEGLRDGSVDLVIGTHRLFSSETKFKDLGLVIVDEEQRFGVEHKEQLKKLRANVDVLTMSATPIPRTLEMAVTGIREMSTITTPPEERHPVLTFVGPYEQKQIGAAIRRELLREGQVFYIHNRVESIDRAAARLREIVPEARIQTAHGQMGESQLEQVVVDFWEKKFDVLVSTTIVESGIDISNANTLIVERGDNFGLSQLHQLRGRVGRGRERGYAYFLYPPEKPLTETAHERLATIAQHTEMGAGMYVAMKDLEIRGAGNLLGGEQSGHIAGVGFDLYVRMVGEAVADYRASLEGGVEEEPPLEVKIELPVDAHVPHDYAPGERLRLQAYRAIASASSEEDIAAVREELADRYGKLPEPVENLLLVAALRMLARACGVSDITLQGSNIRFGPVELRESQELRLKRLHPRTVLKPATRQILVPRPATGKIGGKPLVGRELLAWVGEFLTTILGS
ncbi:MULTISPECIES: transcription-repair coupling factor [unclassified Streptomyces]|uniref:transcription-repair coupling factor n=1 Tax=unclassified Streptomyces TaxID=2593676 RepID=UPI0008851B70|nr:MULTISPECIES: transcription-repair coupling factor [unclassified Streptomyces]PBC82850.1 transcription-repair coupling factor [Streptomyces sp. 2321.6]SDR46701.1 transcription-repair coupling factor [Streptomyces sp. KS_16]SEC74140.1 transcription-repair coupling factor [Streptomyces sp. 2133.1]SEE91151.1 transcription-repair coupling factor [Streptomyces sp. 2112.3]SNC68926.1 transcription-repair coupling factor (superfamily II helicase) [Streptomyces sp. 2114.4]